MVLQRIIDSKVIKTTDTAKLQAMGVIFGDLVSKKVQVEWMLVTDEYGTDPVLKPKGHEVSIGALTMISKRIEKGEDFEVKDMYDWITKLIIEKYAVK